MLGLMVVLLALATLEALRLAYGWLSAEPDSLGLGLTFGGVIADMAILGLILWEDFLFPFINRPDPVYHVRLHSWTYRKEFDGSLQFLDRNIPLAEAQCAEVWVNVENKGKTALRRMRMKSKFVVIPGGKSIYNELERLNLAKERSNAKNLREFVDEIKEKDPAGKVMDSVEDFIGLKEKFVATSKTPEGSIPVSWTTRDGKTEAEIDLAPLDDEASAKILSIYRIPEQLFTKARFELPHTKFGTILIQVGNSSAWVLNTREEDGSPMFDLVGKVWLVGENLTSHDPYMVVVEFLDLEKKFANVGGHDWWTGEYRSLRELFEKGDSLRH